MALKSRMQRAAKAGYDPARGRPEPGVGAVDGNFTHTPHRNGTVCGEAITDAASYTVDEPTCPDCLRYYSAIQRQGQRMMANAAASQAKFDAEHKATK
jgi:hypothetical protein